MLKHKIPVQAMLLLLVLWQGAGISFAEDYEVAGVVGMYPVESNSCVGVWIPLSPEEALAGVRWYNNDGTIYFPKVYITGGGAEGPGDIYDAIPDLEMVQGGSSAWSQISFTEHYASSYEEVYVIFKLPYGSVKVADGEGGGAGIGYYSNGLGLPGWVTLDGVDWFELHPEYGFAVEPITVERDEWTVLLERADKSNYSLGGSRVITESCG